MPANLLEKPTVTETARTLSVWSAPPTPLTSEGLIDVPALRRTIDHHVALGCEGLMLAGTCGEGPWLRRGELEKLVRSGVEHAGGSIEIAVQATDNSPGLILERLEMLAGWGARQGVVAQPYFFMNGTPARLRDFYLEIWKHSPLPVFFYDRGKNATVPVPLEIVEDITSDPLVRGVKDSSSDKERFAAFARVRRQRPEFRLFSGNEFSLLQCLQDGYDGAFFGGAVVSGQALRRCMDLFTVGDLEAARKLDEETKQALFDIYGGPKITCWLAGLKYALVRLGVFDGWTNIPGYPLTDSCCEAIDRLVERTEWLHVPKRA